MSFLLLAMGFAALIKSSDILIESASKLAKMFAIPSFIVGITVVAFGTSAPELVIGVLSGIRQSNLITLGDVVGSCIANIALIIGIVAIIRPLNIDRAILYKEIPISFGVQLLLTVMLMIDGVLSRVDALLLLVLFVVFLFYIISRSKKLSLSYINDESETLIKIKTENKIDNKIDIDIEHEEINKTSKIKLMGTIALSIAGVFIGGHLVINSCTSIAYYFGLSDVLIGVTIVALGTSLPELITSIVAAVKRQSDIAIGNIIGSNIFNILLVLGVSSLIHPISKISSIYIDIFIMLFVTLVLFFIPLRRKNISRLGGIALITLYVSYIVFKVLSI